VHAPGGERPRWFDLSLETRMKRFLMLAGAGALALTSPLLAQPSMTFVEARGGGVTPTFDIADVAKTGTAFGVTLGIRPNPRWVLMAEYDDGSHKDKATGEVDITTRHYMAKVGYSLTGPRERGWDAVINLGLGAVGFDVEGAPEQFTYFAINAGAKIAYNFNRSFAFVLSPQGDIAFGKEDEISTTNAWVWPVTAGLRVNF
jgi:hypothetical protein